MKSFIKQVKFDGLQTTAFSILIGNRPRLMETLSFLYTNNPCLIEIVSFFIHSRNFIVLFNIRKNFSELRAGFYDTYSYYNTKQLVASPIVSTLGADLSYSNIWIEKSLKLNVASLTSLNFTTSLVLSNYSDNNWHRSIRTSMSVIKNFLCSFCESWKGATKISIFPLVVIVLSSLQEKGYFATKLLQQKKHYGGNKHKHVYITFCCNKELKY